MIKLSKRNRNQTLEEKKMSLKLREFARTDVKSERIYGSDDEDDIRYLPPDLPQPSAGKSNITKLYFRNSYKYI